MMMHHPSDVSTGARRESYGDYREDPDTLSIVTTPPEPTYAELRARNLLAQSILNHRATADGLSRDDAAAVAGALVGVWDD